MKCTVLQNYIESGTYNSVTDKLNFKTEFQEQDVQKILFDILSKSDSFKEARNMLAEYMTDAGLKQLSGRFAKYKYSQTKRKEKSHLYVSKTVLKKLNKAQKQLGTKSHDELLEYLVEGGHQWVSDVEETEHTKNLSVVMALLPDEIKETLKSKFEQIAQEFYFAGAASVPVDKRKNNAVLDQVERSWEEKLVNEKVDNWGV